VGWALRLQVTTLLLTQPLFVLLLLLLLLLVCVRSLIEDAE
jgi:hypothetical protein